MKQISDYKYEVAQGETVTFEVIPEGTGLTVKASQNGESISNSGTSAKAEFSFQITESPGRSHFAQLECSFQPGDPEAAKYDIVLSSSHGQLFPVPPVTKASPIKDPMYTFDVVE